MQSYWSKRPEALIRYVGDPSRRRPAGCALPASNCAAALAQSDHGDTEIATGFLRTNRYTVPVIHLGSPHLRTSSLHAYLAFSSPTRCASSLTRSTSGSAPVTPYQTPRPSAPLASGNRELTGTGGVYSTDQGEEGLPAAASGLSKALGFRGRQTEIECVA